MLRQYDRVGTHCGLRFSQYLLWMIQLNSDKIHENIAAAAFYYRVLTYTDTQENCLSAELAADKITAADLWKICTASNLTMLKICRGPISKAHRHPYTPHLNWGEWGSAACHMQPLGVDHRVPSWSNYVRP